MDVEVVVADEGKYKGVYKDEGREKVGGVGSDYNRRTLLCAFRPFQANTFQCLRNGFIRIDAIHNITQYPDFLLFIIIARDQWRHGA